LPFFFAFFTTFFFLSSQQHFFIFHLTLDRLKQDLTLGKPTLAWVYNNNIQPERREKNLREFRHLHAGVNCAFHLSLPIMTPL
jgi:hypothetical protein